MEGSLRRPIFAVVSHLCKSTQFNVIKKLLPNQNCHTSAHACCRLGPAKRDRRKLIIEENNGSRGAKSERCGTTANFTLLLEALFGGAARAPYLLLVCKLSQCNVSLKMTQFSKIYITARMLGPGSLPPRGIAGS